MSVPAGTAPEKGQTWDLDPERVKRINDAARRSDCTPDALIEAAVEEMLRRHEAVSAAPERDEAQAMLKSYLFAPGHSVTEEEAHAALARLVADLDAAEREREEYGDEMAAFARIHGLSAALDHMRYIGLANIANDRQARLVAAEKALRAEREIRGVYLSALKGLGAASTDLFTLRTIREALRKGDELRQAQVAALEARVDAPSVQDGLS